MEITLKHCSKDALRNSLLLNTSVNRTRPSGAQGIVTCLSCTTDKHVWLDGLLWLGLKKKSQQFGANTSYRANCSGNTALVP